MYAFYFKAIIHTLPLFFKGLGVTILVSGISLVAGTLLGVLCGIFRTVKRWGLSRIMGAYADYMRGIPFLVHIFIIYFILPEIGIQLEPFPAAAIALTIYAGAYISEIVAAGILSVPRGQREAATAYGLNAFQQMRYIVFPQAFKVANCMYGAKMASAHVFTTLLPKRGTPKRRKTSIRFALVFSTFMNSMVLTCPCAMAMPWKKPKHSSLMAIGYSRWKH